MRPPLCTASGSTTAAAPSLLSAELYHDCCCRDQEPKTATEESWDWDTFAAMSGPAAGSPTVDIAARNRKLRGLYSSKTSHSVVTAGKAGVGEAELARRVQHAGFGSEDKLRLPDDDTRWVRPTSHGRDFNITNVVRDGAACMDD